MIAEKEPPRPSTIAPEDVQRALRGDLDNILVTALRKEPELRYSGVTAFADDLRRYLDGRPVRARPATLGYRASKFIRRNRLSVAAAVLLLLTLLGGIAATLWQSRKANLERARAERRFNEVRQLARSVMFDYHDPIAALPGSLAIRQKLVADALTYLDRLSQDGSGDLSLLRELADAYDKVAAVQGGSTEHARASTPPPRISATARVRSRARRRRSRSASRCARQSRRAGTIRSISREATTT